MNQAWCRVVVASGVLLLGCGGGVEPSDVAGTYQAQQFTVDLNGVRTDMRTRGASIALELRDDGTLGGQLVIPAVAGVQSTPIDEAITGTYLIRSGDLLLLNYTSPSGYLHELNFTVDLPELRAYVVIQRTDESGFLTLILRRQ